METGCEHEESSPIGKCAICERTVCGDCYRDIFGTMICDLHQKLEDESSWELVGLYNSSEAQATRRFILEEDGITSLVVDTDEEAIELYVPSEEKTDAFEALAGDNEGTSLCEDCQVQFSSDLSECPICGSKPAG